MSYYLLEERIRPCNAEDIHGGTDSKYVAVLTTPEWKEARDSFDMGIELEPDAGNIHNTKAEVNYDSLTGTFLIPDRHDLKEKDSRFAFALDEKGIVLSGGETQKLLLAKAMYKDGPMLILDEPTSALDPIAESTIYEEYNQLADKKTAVFISHRLASTKFCDRILFLDGGQIVEEGSHEQLMEKGGKYREIFDIQSHYYKEEKSEKEAKDE